MERVVKGEEEEEEEEEEEGEEEEEDEENKEVERQLVIFSYESLWTRSSRSSSLVSRIIFHSMIRSLAPTIRE